MSGTSGGPNSFGSSYGVMSNPNAGSGDPYSSQGTYNKYGNSSQFGGGNPWMRQQPFQGMSKPMYGGPAAGPMGMGSDIRDAPPDDANTSYGVGNISPTVGGDWQIGPASYNPQVGASLRASSQSMPQTGGGQDYASGDPYGNITTGQQPFQPYNGSQQPQNGAGGGNYNAGGVGNPGGGASSQGAYDPRNPTGQPTFRDQYGMQRFSPLPSYGGIPGSQWWGQTQAPSSIFGYGQGSNGYDQWNNRFGGNPLQSFLQSLRGYGR